MSVKFGISIITCTKRYEYIDNIFRNFLRQDWDKKELIIIVNRDDISIKPYKKMAEKYNHVSVYRKDEAISLGRCLNSGVRKAKYSHVAKFDDDDYYAPRYLTEAMQLIRSKKAHVLGKRAHFVWLEGNNVLILRNPGKEYKRVSFLPGATLVFKKIVFRKVRFPNLTVGEDTKFCIRCRAKGYKVYSGGKYNFVALRRKNSKDHTWIISEKKLLSENAIIFRDVENYKKYVTRNE